MRTGRRRRSAPCRGWNCCRRDAASLDADAPVTRRTACELLCRAMQRMEGLTATDSVLDAGYRTVLQ